MTASRKKRSIRKGKYYFVYKSAVDGRFVTADFAERNPFVTFRHRIERPERLWKK